MMLFEEVSHPCFHVVQYLFIVGFNNAKDLLIVGFDGLLER